MKEILVVLFCAFSIAGCQAQQHVGHGGFSDLPGFTDCGGPIVTCALVKSAMKISGNPAYEIDLAATQNAPWEQGEVTIVDSCYTSNGLCYTVFLGVTTEGKFLIQDYYDSGIKYSDPYWIRFFDAAKEDIASRSHLGAGFLDGFVTLYYENGQKMQELIYQNNDLYGKARSWHENGQLRYLGQYRNSMAFGIWRTWDEQGNLIEENDYDIR